MKFLRNFDTFGSFDIVLETYLGHYLDMKWKQPNVELLYSVFLCIFCVSIKFL
jgi:hypothetical protein